MGGEFLDVPRTVGRMSPIKPGPNVWKHLKMPLKRQKNNRCQRQFVSHIQCPVICSCKHYNFFSKKQDGGHDSGALRL